MDPILIALCVILGIVFLIFSYCSYIKAKNQRISFWFSLRKLSIDKPMEDYARLILDEQGIADVEVKRAGFFSSLFIGNTYSVKKRTIYLSWMVAKRSTVISLAMVCKLVGIAKMHAEGVKGLKFIQLNTWLNWLPFVMFPLAVVGLILDLVVLKSVGTYTIILTSIGLAITLFAFIMGIVSVKRERTAYSEGEKILLDMQILEEAEEKKIKKYISNQRKVIVINCVFNSFMVIYYSLKLLWSTLKLLGKVGGKK